MTDILVILNEKNSDDGFRTLTAQAPSGEQITFKVLLDAVAKNNKNYLLLQPLKTLDEGKEANEIVCERIRVGNKTTLIPAAENEAIELLCFYHGEKGEDIIELLDENGEKTGEKFIRKFGCRPPDGKYFAVVEVWVRLSKQRLLLIQRHPKKDFGLKWECPGGTVRIAETTLDAVKRELFEETQIIVPCEKFVYLGVTKRSNWFCHSYLLDIDGYGIKIKLQSEEVVASRFVDICEMQNFVDELTDGHKETFLKYIEKITSVN